MESVNGTCTFRSPPLRSIEMKEMKMNVFLISSLCYGSRCCFVPVVTVKKAPSFFARRGRQAPSLCHRYVTKHLSVCTVVCPCWFQQHNNIERIIQSWILQMDYYYSVYEWRYSCVSCNRARIYSAAVLWIISSGRLLMDLRIMTPARHFYCTS